MDAERAHDLGLRLIAGGFVSSTPPGDERLSTTAFGTALRHPVGLAAGFDKNAAALEGLYGVGFSFVEVGTVTPQPQPGNAKPRMWRYPEDRSIVNRLGFNSLGAPAVARRLEAYDGPMPYGLNIGKNRWTPNEEAWRDFYMAAKTLRDFGSYFVVNVSSPNTPGLRALQSVSELDRIVQAVRDAGVHQPLFVKLSPDQPDEELAEIAQWVGGSDLTGVVATNTTVQHSHETGGLSGAPLRDRAAGVCSLLRREMGSQKQIIAVGGIFCGQDLAQRMAAGATACQIYTSFVYRGPSAVRDILDEYLSIYR
jgi:dihydroorotate dehydrogenase